MINSKEQLKRIIKKEKRIYFPREIDLLKNCVLREQYYFCWKYVRLLRIVEYHHNACGLFHKIMYVILRAQKNRLGNRIGLELWDNCFDEGLRIFHGAGIIVNANAKIGKNCVLHGNRSIIPRL